MYIRLTRGYTTVIDEVDADLANFKWSSQEKTGNVYAIRTGSIRMHRVILSRMLGRELLPSELVDHEDGDGLNNRRKNLRLATHTNNMRNRKKHKNNTTGYKGVYKNGKRFIARIRVDKQLINLGSHDTPELAARAYDDAAVIHYGDFARLNFLRNS